MPVSRAEWLVMNQWIEYNVSFFVKFGLRIMEDVGSFDYEKSKVFFHLPYTRSKCAALEFLRSCSIGDIFRNLHMVKW